MGRHYRGRLKRNRNYRRIEQILYATAKQETGVIKLEDLSGIELTMNMQAVARQFTDLWREANDHTCRRRGLVVDVSYLTNGKIGLVVEGYRKAPL